MTSISRHSSFSFKALNRGLASFSWGYVRPLLVRLLFILISIFLSAIAVLMGGQSLKKLGTGFHQSMAAWDVFGPLFIVGLFIAIIAFSRTYQTAYLAHRITEGFRRSLIEKSLLLEQAALNATRLGGLTHLWQKGLGDLERVLAQGIPVFLRSSLQLLGALGLVIYESPILAFMSLALAFILILPLRALMGFLKKFSTIHQEHQLGCTAFITDIWSHLSFIKGLSAQEEITMAYGELERPAHRSFRQHVRLRSFMIGLMIFLVFSALLLLLLYGRKGVLDGRLSSGDLMAFAYYAVIIGSSLNSIAEHYPELQNMSLILGDIKTFLDQPTERRGGKRPPSDLSIRFENIFFSYPQTLSSAHDPALSMCSSQGEVSGIETLAGERRSRGKEYLMNERGAISNVSLLEKGFSPLTSGKALNPNKKNALQAKPILAGENASVLRGATFHWPMGSILGIVGPSGGGKSTLLALLMGFYQPTHGTIRIGKTDLQKMDLALWRRQIMWVGQETLILPSTLRDNLCFGLGSFSTRRLTEALDIVGFGNVLQKWPQGLSTWIGSGGQPLSGGERQKIALARALLSDRPLLLFDEPTSALDAESEHGILESLLPLFKGKSCLIITHRLSSLKGVDNILVLSQGLIAESGTHSVLKEQKGLYASYVHHQTSLGPQDRNLSGRKTKYA